MNGNELIELNNLRNEIEMYKKFCNSEYFKSLWTKGWKARCFYENLENNCYNCDCKIYDMEMADKLWEDDRQEMWKEETKDAGWEAEDEILDQLKGV